ncbi:transposase, partial [Blautia hansenii DSM 20583]
MTKKYSEEFKKQMVQEYLKGTSYPKLSKEYQVAKSTLVGWVKKSAKNASLQSHKPLPLFRKMQRKYTSFIS